MAATVLTTITVMLHNTILYVHSSVPRAVHCKNSFQQPMDGLIWVLNNMLQLHDIHRLSYQPLRTGPTPVSVGVNPLLSGEDL